MPVVQRARRRDAGGCQVKTSELIKRLQDCIAAYGDLTVAIDDADEGSLLEVQTVEAQERHPWDGSFSREAPKSFFITLGGDYSRRIAH